MLEAGATKSPFIYGKAESFNKVFCHFSWGTSQSLPVLEHPSYAVLKENGFTQIEYSKYHVLCLKG